MSLSQKPTLESRYVRPKRFGTAFTLLLCLLLFSCLPAFAQKAEYGVQGTGVQWDEGKKVFTIGNQPISNAPAYLLETVSGENWGQTIKVNVQQSKNSRPDNGYTPLLRICKKEENISILHRIDLVWKSKKLLIKIDEEQAAPIEDTFSVILRGTEDAGDTKIEVWLKGQPALVVQGLGKSPAFMWGDNIWGPATWDSTQNANTIPIQVEFQDPKSLPTSPNYTVVLWVIVLLLIGNGVLTYRHLQRRQPSSVSALPPDVLAQVQADVSSLKANIINAQLPSSSQIAVLTNKIDALTPPVADGKQNASSDKAGRQETLQSGQGDERVSGQDVRIDFQAAMNTWLEKNGERIVGDAVRGAMASWFANHERTLIPNAIKDGTREWLPTDKGTLVGAAVQGATSTWLSSDGGKLVDTAIQTATKTWLSSNGERLIQNPSPTPPPANTSNFTSPSTSPSSLQGGQQGTQLKGAREAERREDGPLSIDDQNRLRETLKCSGDWQTCWRHYRQQLQNYKDRLNLQQFTDDLQLLEHYYRVLIEQWDDTLLQAEQRGGPLPMRWPNRVLGDLDTRLYRDPAYQVGLNAQNRDQFRAMVNLDYLLMTIKEGQIQRREELKKWGLERIEGEVGKTPVIPHELEPDRETYEPTNRPEYHEKFCRIEPGRGGYRWQGEVVRITTAVFYRYRA